MKVPLLVSVANIVYQHDGGVIGTTSQLSSSAITVKLDPDDARLIKINDKDCVGELVAFLAIVALRDDVPFGNMARTGNNDFVTVCSKELPSPDVRDDESVIVAGTEDPLRNDRLVHQFA